MPAQQTGVRVLPHIRRALEAGAPVVALETSVIAQGLPVPENADAARRMVSAVERAGAVAAFTAVVCGAATVGLDAKELERFLRREGIRKVSARDIPAAVAERADGATTVAATLAIASRAGVRVMATGGIGGVHRRARGGATAAIDESADLNELARTPMIVVCAGAKSILDLPATWERLDTLGIPVVGYRTDEFPGFYTASTGIRLTTTIASAEDLVAIASAHFALERTQAVLVVQPPPPEVALDGDVVDDSVNAAMREAEAADVRGAEVTPFLLAAVSRMTAGGALSANLALLENNAFLAGQIAGALKPDAGGTTS